MVNVGTSIFFLQKKYGCSIISNSVIPQIMSMGKGGPVGLIVR